MLRCLLIFVVAGYATCEPGQAQDNSKGCPLSVATQQVDEFVENRIAEIASKQNEYLMKLNDAMKNAKQLNTAIGKQLTPSEIAAFNENRFRAILGQSEQAILGRYQQDAHTIEQTVEAAELSDIYEIDPTTLSSRDPRQFYFSVLTLLRQAQPQPQFTQLSNDGKSCDMEGGLFFEEAFYVEQSKKAPDPHVQQMIADLERLRTFQRLCWAIAILSNKDLQAAKWNNNTQIPDLPDSVTPGVRTMDISAHRYFKWVN